MKNKMTRKEAESLYIKRPEHESNWSFLAWLRFHNITLDNELKND